MNGNALSFTIYPLIQYGFDFFTEAVMNQRSRNSLHTNGWRSLALVGALVLGTLVLASNAQATTVPNNRVNIKLTVILQVPAVENPTNVFTYETLQYKLTNKEMLRLLSILYPGALIPGTILTVGNGGAPFVLILPNGSMQSVSAEHFTWDGSDHVTGRTTNTIQGTLRQQIFGAGGAWLDLNSDNLFELAGGLRSQHNQSDTQDAWSLLFKLAGEGKLSGDNAFITGTIGVKLHAFVP